MYTRPLVMFSLLQHIGRIVARGRGEGGFGEKTLVSPPNPVPSFPSRDSTCLRLRQLEAFNIIMNQRRYYTRASSWQQPLRNPWTIRWWPQSDSKINWGR